MAWLTASTTDRRFLVRIEDLDDQRCRPEYADQQLRDLAAIGIAWDGEPMVQSRRSTAYAEALSRLTALGATFECFCTRREIRTAQSAPHGDVSRYPGTCRDLDAHQRAERSAAGRRPAIRLRGADQQRSWDDLVLGPRVAAADDVVLARADGAHAYNLAVVVDDLAQQVDQVVRGDDLVDQTATQVLLIELLGGRAMSYGHVPLVLNTAGRRLAKRDGAVTLGDLAAAGWSQQAVVRALLRSFGPAVDSAASTLREAADSFDIRAVPRDPWIFVPPSTC